MMDHDKEEARPGAGPDSGGSGARMTEQARSSAQEMAGRAKEQGRTMFEQQKESAARQMDSVAGAFRNTAGQLQGEGQSQAGRYIGLAADRLESFGRQLREKDTDALLHDVEDLGRRSPAALFAGTLAAGFMFARFLKSSSQRRHDTAHAMSGSTGARSSRHADYPLAETPHPSAVHAAHGEVTRVPPGASGTAGTSGVSGIAGSSGVSGIAGSSGVSGIAGSSGTASTSSATSTSSSSIPGGPHGNR